LLGFLQIPDFFSNFRFLAPWAFQAKIFIKTYLARRNTRHYSPSKGQADSEDATREEKEEKASL